MNATTVQGTSDGWTTGDFDASWRASLTVSAAIGESIDNETLGGATTHSEISGVTDYKAKDDKDALDKIKNIVDKIGDFDKAGFNRVESKKPAENPDDIFGILPASRSDQYDMVEIIKRLVDDSEFEQYKEGYGKTILTGYARIDGWAVWVPDINLGVR